MGLSDFMASAEAQSNIVTFGRDRQVANPLTINITENGEYNVAPYAKAIVNVEGYKNYKETFTGKANNLNIDDAFSVDLASGNVSAYIEIDTSPLQMGINKVTAWLYSNGGSNVYLLAGFVQTTLEASSVINVSWVHGSPSYARALMAGNVVDMSAYLSMLDYTMTVYHHTMPEDEEP